MPLTSPAGALPSTGDRGLTAALTFSLAGRTANWVLFWIVDPGPSRQAVVEELTVH